MAGRSWEERYEADQSRLRDAAPKCQHRDEDGVRCRSAGYLVYDGYFPVLSAGRYCPAHRKLREGG